MPHNLLGIFNVKLEYEKREILWTINRVNCALTVVDGKMKRAKLVAVTTRLY